MRSFLLFTHILLCYTSYIIYVGAFMKFSTVTSVFSEIQTTSSRLEMTTKLAHLFAQANAQEARILAYMSLGTLQPPYGGMQFNISEKTMLTVVARACDLEESEAKKLAKTEGDLGTVVMLHKGSGTDDFTVTQLYDQLSAIEDVGGTGSQEKKITLLAQLLKNITPQEALYVVRMVLGRLRLGFSDMTLIDALSWMIAGDKSLRANIEDAYNVCADIGLIAQTIKEHGIDGIRQMHIVVGIPIRPAAAERLPSPAAVVAKLGHCVAQPKLDGFRVQIHIDKKNNSIRFFSRNLLDMSSMFPDLVAYLKSIPVDTLIVEGEAIAYDPDTNNFLPFQETVKRKRKHAIDQAAEEIPLKLFLFDLLYLNGVEYLTKTHKERRATLLELLKNMAHEHIQVIEEKPITTGIELEHYFLENITAGLEGLVVKREDAIYQPGKRNFNWIKVKRHKEGELDDTIDCVVLGYYAGKGKRAQFGIGAFLVGVYNKKSDQFETIAKIGTGLSDVEWKDLKKQCDKASVAHKPINVVCAKELFPDCWVEPSIVCVVRADEITLSPLHTAGKTIDNLGYALRFPRIMAYRDDKSIYDCTEINEIKELYAMQYKS